MRLNSAIATYSGPPFEWF